MQNRQVTAVAGLRLLVVLRRRPTDPFRQSLAGSKAPWDIHTLILSPSDQTRDTIHMLKFFIQRRSLFKANVPFQGPDTGVCIKDTLFSRRSMPLLKHEKFIWETE